MQHRRIYRSLAACLPTQQAKEADIRALMLSTVLMGIAGFTAVGAASSPDAAHDEHH